MPQFEHGLYEPGEDARAFDGAEEEDEVENSRLPLLIVLALLVLAMFAGFVWLAYNEGVARGRSENPMLAADAGAAKPAANAGASSQAYKGFKIYEQPAPPDDDTGATQTATPVKPVPAQAPKPAAKTEAPSAPKPAPAAKVAPEPQSAPKLAAAPKPAAPPALKPATTSAPKPAATPAPKPAPAPSAPVATAPPRALTANAPAQPQQPAASGAYLLQIGAYKSQAEANAAWTAYKAKHAVLVQGYAPNVAQADLGEKGVWYRLRIAGFSSKDAANALCDRLKADGGACFLGK